MTNIFQHLIENTETFKNEYNQILLLQRSLEYAQERGLKLP